MSTLKTYRDVIDLWRSRAGLARLIGVKDRMVRNWYALDRIPEAHFLAVAEAAKRCDFPGVTYASLSAIIPGAAKGALPQQDDGEAI